MRSDTDVKEAPAYLINFQWEIMYQHGRRLV